MYRAKEVRAQHLPVLFGRHEPRAVERLALETGLRRALERRELVLHYQPLVDLRTRRVVAVGHCCAGTSPNSGLVQPAEFIRCPRRPA